MEMKVMKILNLFVHAENIGASVYCQRQQQSRGLYERWGNPYINQ